jgi:hypothetical protein
MVTGTIHQTAMETDLSGCGGTEETNEQKQTASEEEMRFHRF